MDTKGKFIGFLMGSALILSVPLAYADNGNGGNMAGGQAAAVDVAPLQAAPVPDASEKQEHHWKHGDHKGGFFHKLNLTDDQKKALKVILDQQRETMKADFKQIKANREAFDKVLTESTLDMNKVADLQAQLKAIQAQMVDTHLSSTLEVRKILNPEQFAKFLKFQKRMFIEKFHKGDREGRGHRHHDHDEDGDE